MVETEEMYTKRDVSDWHARNAWLTKKCLSLVNHALGDCFKL